METYSNLRKHATVTQSSDILKWTLTFKKIFAKLKFSPTLFEKITIICLLGVSN